MGHPHSSGERFPRLESEAEYRGLRLPSVGEKRPAEDEPESPAKPATTEDSPAKPPPKKKAKGGGELYDLREMHRVLRGEDEEQIDDGGAGDSTVVAGGGAARLLGTPTLRSHVEKQPTVRSLRDGGMCASLVFRQRSVDFGVDSKPLRDSLAVGFQLLFEDVAKDKGSKATTKRK